MNPNVYVTRPIPAAGIELLRKAGLGIEVNPNDRVLTRPELLEAVRNRDGVLCLLTDAINGEVFDAAGPGCKGFANMAVGYNNVDVQEATRRKVPISNTPGVLTDATADLAWALIMMTARRLGEGERWMRSGAWPGWGPLQLVGGDFVGKTLGIVGAGRIGSALARRSIGFDMRVLYYSRSSSPALERFCPVARRVELDTLLRESDYVSVHLPLSAETRHFFGEPQFRKMKPTACFINTARGPIHDETALVRALKEKWIAGAGLDVYEAEPTMAPGLVECENAVLIPHLGSATQQTRDKMATMAATNLVAMVRGERPPNCVNPAIYDDR